MTNKQIISQLETNKQIFKNLLSLKTEQEILWRPSPGKWCLLEIVCHLVDEEREDFRARVTHTLENPKEAMKGIDPVGWVLKRNYMGQDYNEKVVELLHERERSVNWLNTQINARWDNTICHPTLGTLSATLFLTNWLAHDYLHIRQIIRYQYQYLKEQTAIDLNYAGTW